jgi:glucokinase
MMADPCLLIGDIGGTNARFAFAHPDEPGFFDELTLSCADFETSDQGIAAYLERSGKSAPDVTCLAVAGPVMDGTVHFLNNNWEIDGHRLQEKLPSSHVRLLNDFEAIAYSIPLLGEEHISTVGLVPSGLGGKSEFNIGVLGPGTGLGVAGLLGRMNHFYPVTGEGSHAGFAPENRTQIKVLRQLRQRHERVSQERLISGPGLEGIYWALCKIRGKQTVKITAAEIFSRVLAKEDVIATESVQLFYEVLGQVAGNLALLLGAYDGIYLAGGILKRYPDLLKSSNFRSGFENKGRHRPLMEQVPTLLIQHPQPGLLGASHCARELYRHSAS